MIKRAERLFVELERAILSGEYGKSGEAFVTVRGLAKEKRCSLHCAAEVFSLLLKERLIYRAKNRFFITFGICTRESPLGRYLSDCGGRRLFGVMAGDAANPFFSSLIDHLQKVALSKGSELIVAYGGGDAEREAQILDTFLDLKCSGGFSCVPISADGRKLFERYPLPIVMLAEESTVDTVDAVLVDNFSAGMQVSRHLMGMGCRSFCYITEDSYIKTDLRLQGFRIGLNNCGFDLPDESVAVISAQNGDERAREISRFVSEILKSSEKDRTRLPIGIFCVHDLIAVEVLKAAKRRMAAVPRDVMVVGFDDLPISKLFSPRLTTVSYRYGELAQKAYEAMTYRISSPSKKACRYEIGSSLIVRQTTSPSGENH